MTGFCSPPLIALPHLYHDLYMAYRVSPLNPPFLRVWVQGLGVGLRVYRVYMFLWYHDIHVAYMASRVSSLNPPFLRVRIQGLGVRI